MRRSKFGVKDEFYFEYVELKCLRNMQVEMPSKYYI